MPKRVFDCFTFFNEVELLKIRMNTLSAFVDYFVIVEATHTFQGNPKPLVFLDNIAQFDRFRGQIIHVVVDDMPVSDDPRAREHHQRRAIRRGLSHATPADIIIISDVDELLRPSAVAEMRAKDGYFILDMPMFQFYLNARALDAGWNKVFAYSYRLDASIPDYSFVRVLQDKTFSSFAGENHRIENGGWHFTFLGGAERVREKLNAYSHKGGVLDPLLTEGGAERHLAAGYDLGGARITRLIELDESFPPYVLENQEYLTSIGYIKPTAIRIRELEDLFVRSEKARRNVILKAKAGLDEIKTARPESVFNIAEKCKLELEEHWRAL